MKLKVIIERGEDGFYIASCPVLKSCWTQGKTEKEALDNIKEAVELYLETDPSDLQNNKMKKTFEIAI